MNQIITNLLELEYYYTSELNQLDLMREIEASYPKVNISKKCIESENQAEIKVKALPCFVFKSKGEVIELYGEQLEVELRTLIEELL